MSSFSAYKKQMEQVRKLGECLEGGEFIESPFDLPVEEESRGDPDQRDDDQNFSKERNLCLSLEPDLTGAKYDIKSVEYPPRLLYFLDGSLRTKYLGEYLEGQRCFPILSSEVSCAVVKKVGGSLEKHRIAKKLSFIFPHKDSGLISDTKFEKMRELDNLWGNDSFLRIEFLLKTDLEASDVRTSMLAKARDIMHNLEHKVAENLDRGEDWLVMDGAIRKGEFLRLENVIGLAKSFSRKPIFDLGDGKPLMIATYLSRVREGERSAVFKKESGENVAFWYVRIRTYPPMEPLGGLVKVDLKLAEDELSNDMIQKINEISAEIYAFRSPSIYPYPRWPSFIYPIRLCEMIIRSTYMNNEIKGYFGRELKKAIGREVS